MSKKYPTLLIVVLLIFNTFGVLGEETDVESQPNYEYIQIFKSIPALFEYLLNALEERPEILEKNDVTVFKRNIDITENDEFEKDETKIQKRDIACDNNGHDQLEETYNMDKRDAENRGQITKTTKAYEYGNSNVVLKGYDATNVKRFASKILSADDLQSLKDKAKSEKITSKKINSRRKRNVFKLSDDDVFLGHDNAFLGFEHFFGLDLNPEDIEERILTAEKLLEEYNSNKEKDE